MRVELEIIRENVYVQGPEDQVKGHNFEDSFHRVTII